MRRSIPVLLMVFLCLGIPINATVSDAESVADNDEYWCYGDLLKFSFGSDSANISWKITDINGAVLETYDGTELEYEVPKEYSRIYVTQTATTGQGSAEKRVAVNLMHFDEKCVTVLFHMDEGAEAFNMQVFDAYTVCKNRDFIDIPDPLSCPDGMKFGGWYSVVSGSTVNITSDYLVDSYSPTVIHVYPKWLKTHSLTFLTEGSYYDSMVLVEGEELVLPEPPAVKGKIFCGWFLDSKFTIPLTSSSVLSENQVIYAKWVDEDDGSMFNPLFILLIVAAILPLVIYSHIKGKKNKEKRRKRYL